MSKIRKFYRLGTRVINQPVVVAGVYNEDTGNLSMHFSRCAKVDKYDKELGKSMAMGRAMKNPLITIPVGSKYAGKVFRSRAEEFLNDKEFEGIYTRPESIAKKKLAEFTDGLFNSLK